MSDRLVVAALAVLAALALVVAPWGAVNRETGARSALTLLPDRYVDFTGRTQPVQFPEGSTVLVITILGIVLAGAGSAAPGKGRHAVWLASAIVLIGVTGWGLARFGEATDAARVTAVRSELEAAIADPSPRQDPDVLRVALGSFEERTLDENLAALREGG
ncbi:MAG TPA: hypothetical protein VFF10_10840, partial [Trueperaceae bacterium]|nr:hypothetical protein [Trueperaceae bacterium]